MMKIHGFDASACEGRGTMSRKRTPIDSAKTEKADEAFSAPQAENEPNEDEDWTLDI